MILNSKDMNKCYGCFACANVCPKNCIELKQNDEGFFMPHVNTEKCVDCGLCDKVCIIDKSNDDLIKHSRKPTCYYGYHKNDELRKRSASGGIAYALSDYCIRSGGVVFGVVGKLFEDVHHVKACTSEELKALCGSKYVQSRIGHTYLEAKTELKSGRKVLFTGTPCQIAGLYSYLGKDYDNLLTVDLMCHGVPSQKVLIEEVKEIEKEKGKIRWIGRSGKYKFSPSQYIIEFENGNEEVIDEKGMHFRQAFVANLIQRKSCNDCKFSRLPRIGDITVGDQFLGFGRKSLKFLDPKNIGVSSIVVNSEKGLKSINNLDDSFYFGRMTLERTILTHSTLTKGINESPRRKEYFKILKEKGFNDSKPLIETAYCEWKKERIKQATEYRNMQRKNPKLLIKSIINKVKELFL